MDDLPSALEIFIHWWLLIHFSVRASLVISLFYEFRKNQRMKRIIKRNWIKRIGRKWKEMEGKRRGIWHRLSISSYSLGYPRFVSLAWYETQTRYNHSTFVTFRWIIARNWQWQIDGSSHWKEAAIRSAQGRRNLSIHPVLATTWRQSAAFQVAWNIPVHYAALFQLPPAKSQLESCPDHRFKSSNSSHRPSSSN